MAAVIGGSSNVSIDTSTGAPRITGDFSTATLANRVAFKTSVVNGQTVITVTPDGTGTTSQLHLYSSSDYTNYNIGQFLLNSTELSFRAGLAGTATAIPMTFYTSGAERMRIATDGVITAGAGNVLLVSGTAQASTSGTSIDFTGIPSWVKRITVNFAGVSTNGTDAILIQLGDSGGVEATGYVGVGSTIPNGASPAGTSYTAGFGLRWSNAAGVGSGSVTLTLIDAATNLWAASGMISETADVRHYLTAGHKSLSATLDRVRITTSGGVNTFDAGTINILYE